MLEAIFNWAKSIPKEYAVIIFGALPISEVRGAIPLALYFGMPSFKAFWLSVLGNILPIIPWLVFLDPITNALRKIKFLARFFNWFFERTKNKAGLVEKYEALGLAIFVAIPLPMTGAWSGAIAASLFKIKFRYAILAILAGIIIAAVIVLLFCKFGMLSWQLLTS
jgi:uncharacterized membrane protein